MNVGWNLNDSITFLLPNISFLFSQQNECTPPKYVEQSTYTDSDHTEVEDVSSRYMYGSDVNDQCGHHTRQLRPSCTACRRTANLPGLAWQNEVHFQSSCQVEKIYRLIWCLKSVLGTPTLTRG